MVIRDLSFSRLFVDGQMVDERTEAPFELLTWDHLWRKLANTSSRWGWKIPLDFLVRQS